MTGVAEEEAAAVVFAIGTAGGDRGVVEILACGTAFGEERGRGARIRNGASSGS